MVKVVIAVGLTGLLVAVGPAVAQSPVPPAGVLTVHGSATVTQRPDLAHLTVSVVSRAPTLEAAARDHAARVARAGTTLAQVKPQGITVDQGAFTLEEERVPAPQGKTPGQEIVVYRAETRYDVTVATLDRLDPVVAAIVATGLFEVGAARFSVADDEAALDRARRAAMADALHQAEIYAEAGHVRLDGIERIADGEASGPGNVMALSMRMAKVATVGIAAPTTLTFQGSVNVTWHIAPR